MRKYKYTNPDAHGYLMEAKACKKICRELDRLVAKFQRAVEREKAARQAEFETVMQYRSEREIQDDYGYECITEAQYDRYLEIFRAGQKALENAEPTVNELIVSILKRINGEITETKKNGNFLLSHQNNRKQKGNEPQKVKRLGKSRSLKSKPDFPA